MDDCYIIYLQLNFQCNKLRILNKIVKPVTKLTPKVLLSMIVIKLWRSNLGFQIKHRNVFVSRISVLKMIWSKLYWMIIARKIKQKLSLITRCIFAVACFTFQSVTKNQLSFNFRPTDGQYISLSLDSRSTAWHLRLYLCHSMNKG